MISPRILLVEDDFAIRSVIAQVLTDEGHDLTCAANGAEALAILQSARRKPDLILLDLWMPYMSGLEFRELQSRLVDMAGIPIVVITAGGAHDEELRALGLRHVLRKPLELELLLRTIERVLRVTETERRLANGRAVS
jgi:CheY-like chemotaxis protein